MSDPSIERFGKYALLERLAAGGMAEVYLAKSTGAEGIGRFFAIKRILPQFSDNGEFIDMFKEEAKLAMSLHHGNVVQIFEFGIEKGQFYLVMEFVEGQNLRQILNHLIKIAKQFTLEQIVYICKEVAAGLDYAHRCLDRSTGKPLHLIHRDMSPQNIMVSFEGEVKIVDFGIAKAENQIEQTRAGTIKGKFSYMSPEQAEAQVVDLRTDIFSLGIIMWELLTNERLFTSQSEAATLKKIRDCNIPSPRKLNPKVPVELEKIVMKALARDKGVRYQTSAALHKDLNRFLNTEYPDFSQQDFSVFMKSAYAEVFMENRKKLSQYAQAPLPLALDPSTGSFTESMSMDSLQLSLEKPTTPPDAKLQMKNLQLNEDVEARIRQKSLQIQSELQGLSTRSGASLPKTPRPKTTAAPSSGSPIVSALAFITAAFAGWLIFFSDGVQLPKLNFFSGRLSLPSSQPNSSTPTSSASPSEATPGSSALATDAIEQPSSNPKVPVNIQSFPQGAQVQIDGQVVGRTPLSLELDSQRVFRLILTREGYLPYEQAAEKAQAPSTSIRATLVPEPPSGFVSIDVKGATPQTLIKINDIRLSEKLPLRRFRVPAGVPVRVQVVDPFTNLTSEQTITLGQGQVRQLNFNLSKGPRANND